MRKDIYKSKRTKRTEITSWALIVVVVLAIAVAFYLSQGFGTGFRNRIQRTAGHNER
mgnify:CR=1 FL=1